MIVTAPSLAKEAEDLIVGIYRAYFNRERVERMNVVMVNL